MNAALKDGLDRSALAAWRSAPSRQITRALQIASRISSHEFDTLSGHWVEAEERIAVALKARSVVELLSDQIDLLPETRARMSANRKRLKAILRGH